MIAFLVFSVIFARIVTMRERPEVRAEARPDISEPITLGIGGIKGLRGSLP